MAGICGNSKDGAYSVAVSSLYKDDEDGGDVMYECSAEMLNCNLPSTVFILAQVVGSNGPTAFPPDAYVIATLDADLLRN